MYLFIFTTQKSPLLVTKTNWRISVLSITPAPQRRIQFANVYGLYSECILNRQRDLCKTSCISSAVYCTLVVVSFNTHAEARGKPDSVGFVLKEHINSCDDDIKWVAQIMSMQHTSRMINHIFFPILWFPIVNKHLNFAKRLPTTVCHTNHTRQGTRVLILIRKPFSLTFVSRSAMCGPSSDQDRGISYVDTNLPTTFFAAQR